MKRITITLTALVPDDVDDFDIELLAKAVEVATPWPEVAVDVMTNLEVEPSTCTGRLIDGTWLGHPTEGGPCQVHGL